MMESMSLNTSSGLPIDFPVSAAGIVPTTVIGFYSPMVNSFSRDNILCILCRFPTDCRLPGSNIFSHFLIRFFLQSAGGVLEVVEHGGACLIGLALPDGFQDRFMFCNA